MPFRPSASAGLGLAHNWWDRDRRSPFDRNPEMGGDRLDRAVGIGQYILVPDLERFDAKIPVHRPPGAFLFVDENFGPGHRFSRVFRLRSIGPLLFAAPDSRSERAGVGNGVRRPVPAPGR